MQAQHAPTLVRVPERFAKHDWAASRSLRLLLRAARSVVEMLLLVAVVMIAGHVVGAMLGVEAPADPRALPGGPTAQDLEAFTALGALILGLLLTGWHAEHGSLLIIAGATVFGITYPSLTILAVILGAIGVVNLVAWVVGQYHEHRHRVVPAPLEKKATNDHPRPRHIVGMF